MRAHTCSGKSASWWERAGFVSDTALFLHPLSFSLGTIARNASLATRLKEPVEGPENCHNVTMATPKLNIQGRNQHTQPANPVTILTDEECWQLAEKTNFARLGTVENGEVFITPLNIVASEGKIFFRTATGSKLTQLILEEKVTIEFDKAEGGQAYSVNIFGTARLLTDSEEIAKAQQLPLSPWVRTEKIEFVEITPRAMSGRRFILG